jgi:hypothetical protein
LEKAGLKRALKKSSALTDASFGELLKERLLNNLAKEIEQPVMRQWEEPPRNVYPSSAFSFTSTTAYSSVMPYGNYMYDDLPVEPRMVKPKMERSKTKPIALEPKRKFSFD